MAEITFESMACAQEVTPGTPIAAPTVFMNLFGTLDPTIEYYEPDESSGMLAQRMRTKQVRKYGQWNADGPLDPNTLIEFLENIAVAGVTPDNTAPKVLTFTWDYTPTMTADDVEFLTIFFGDPNMTHIFQGSYGWIDTLTIASDASGVDGATLSLSGMTQFPAKLTPPSYPTQAFAPLIAGINMELFLDTSSVIGTTAVTGRVVSAQHVLSGGFSPKYIAAGQTADLTYSRHGRGKRGMVTTVVMEVPDWTEYDIAVLEDTVAKLRVVHNGALIESVTPDFYYHVIVDTYGQFRFTGWGELEGTNRTATFEVHSEYDSTLGADWRIEVQNTASALAS